MSQKVLNSAFKTLFIGTKGTCEQCLTLKTFTRPTIIVDAAEAACMSPRSLAKQLNIGNTASLERRIKRELEEQGKIAERKPLIYSIILNSGSV